MLTFEALQWVLIGLNVLGLIRVLYWLGQLEALSIREEARLDGLIFDDD